MAKTKIKVDKVLKTALDRFEVAKDFFHEDYIRNDEDNRFALGEQWEDSVKNERARDARPCLTENRLLPFINKTVNEIRQTRPSVVVKPVDSGADKETAEILRGIIRNIEFQSDAETAYDTAAKNAISAGFGWIRIGTRYTSPDSFEQEVYIDRVLNPFSVLIDPSSVRLDASDAEYMFTFDDMDKEDFKEKYPESSADGFEPVSYEWLSDGKIRVAEYFYKEYTTKTLYELLNGSVTYDKPFEYKRKRDAEVVTIKYCKLTANEILEEGEFVGDYIPIVPVIGAEQWNNGKRTVYSLIHQAKDPQRMLNYWKSIAVETIALQPKAPYIGAVGQFDTAIEDWANANRVNHPVLEYDMVSDENGVPAPPPVRQPPPTNSGTMMQEAMASAEGINSALGVYDNSLRMQGSDVSGKAIISRQMQGELSTFHFIDNLSTAMKHVGRILVNIIPKVYSGKRIVRILGEDEEEKRIAINQPATKGNGGDYLPSMPGEPQDAFYDLSVGKYDVVVEVGPSYATKRQEAANAILEMARANPRVLEVAGDLLVKSLDIPNADIIAERIKATMPPELLGDDIEAQRLQQMAEQVKMLTEKLEQTELALQVKEEDVKFKQTIEMGKLRNETEEINIKSLKTRAEIEKLNAEANIEIPAEAQKDLAETMQGAILAGAELEEKVEQMGCVLEELISERGHVATGEPEKSPEEEKTE